MDNSLVATKVRVPAQPSKTVHRARLVETLERGVSDYRIVLVSAPAGYGKTTLLAEWAESSGAPVAWLTSWNEDDDLDRFFRHLLAAWGQVQPGVWDSPMGLLLGASTPNSEAVLAAFVNAANEASEPVVFVLDDLHLIVNPGVYKALAFLLEHMPPSFHFVLAGREDPPLPLARFRARRQLLELRSSDLKFSQEETAEFFNRLMGHQLTGDEVVSLQTQLEGWAAGLQLTALSLRYHREEPHELIVSGKHRFIADYLKEDVLANLPRTTRRFLLKTSILSRLSGPLCDTVTGDTGGQKMLEQLERENLFLVPLDDSREWYRYHALFADFLREELGRDLPGEIVHLHRRAARWFLDHDLPERAFSHAVAGEDPDLANDIVLRYAAARLMRGEMKAVEEWLQVLPRAWYTTHPQLDLARAAILFFTGQFDALTLCLDDLEQRLAASRRVDVRAYQGRVTALRCFIACVQNDLALAEALAHQALLDLPKTDVSFRPGVFSALGDTYRQHGRWSDAKACYLKTLEVTHSPVVRAQSVHVFGALADLALRQGRLGEAAGYWRRALALIDDRSTWGSVELPVIGWVHIRMGEVLYEHHDLAGASDHLSRGLKRAELGGDVRALIAAYLLAHRIELASGDIEAAERNLEQARPLVERAPFPDWLGRFERSQVELLLAQGKVRYAADSADSMLQGDAFRVRSEPEVAHLTMARVLVAKGDGPSLDRSLALLEPLLRAADKEGRRGVQIEAMALQALALATRGEVAGALAPLEHALRLAEPEGYVRLFADLGLPMARLLQEARSRDVMPDYVARLLAAFRGSPFRSSPPTLTMPSVAALPEPLSPRELEVLRLLAVGLTNREIADKLIISPETVKKHTGTIYGKLGVSTRTQAAARARELDLLSDTP